MKETDKQNGTKIKFRHIAVAIIFIGYVSVITSRVTPKIFSPTSSEVISTPVDVIKTNTPTILPTSTLYISPTVAETPTQIHNATETKDYLAYLAIPQIGKPQLALYDPANNKHTQVQSGSSGFSLSKDNRLAYAKDGSIYIWDYPFTENTPTEITFNNSSTTEKTILCWSLDGRYLLLSETQMDSKKLLLWDGMKFSDIYNYQGRIYSATWNNNGQFAFTVHDINNTSPEWGELFIWDGKDVVKVSQNPSLFPAWSKNGQLAFLSNRSGVYSISVWDGKSKNNDMPDIKTVINSVSPVAHPTWSNSGAIIFKDNESKRTQSGLLVFCRHIGLNWTLSIWDGKDIVDITQGDYIMAKWTNSNEEFISCYYG